ncbi:helix-turn-helix domain-containing protein [Isoptericola rhizosphaerae]|uniref:helix-turn-helix domain-containing protein n=1 Tax=Isoptericola rhizosphaerae TaxID=3377837 RepID=UPI00383B5C46
MTTTTSRPAALLTPAEAAEYLNVSVRTLASWRLTREEGPEYIRLGTGRRARVRYSPDALAAYTGAGTVRPEPAAR